jgi:2-polyprenyl-3-methyl-5-hydroxy-6-metoxy-1,4-benzoquinol methylase
LNAVRPHLRGRVLDFGCGVGALAAHCSPDGYLGVDIDEESLGAARRNHPGFRFEKELPSGGEFDAIVLLAVIEHIPDPVGLLRRLKTLLHPGGSILLTTPNPWVEGVHAFGARLGLFSQEAGEQHERLYDAAAMLALAGESGLAVREERRFLLGANQLFVLIPSAASAGSLS